MDPFSLATGVIGLVALAYSVAQELDRMIEEFKNVPDEVKKLGEQIHHMSAALEDFRELFDQRVIAPRAISSSGDETTTEEERPRFVPNQKWMKNMDALLTSLIETTQNLKRILHKMDSKKNKFVRHWKWQSLKIEVDSHQHDLDRKAQTLLVMMSTFTSMSDAYLRNEVYHISTQVSNSKAPEPTVSTFLPSQLFKMPNFTRSNSSLALLSSLSSLSLFRSNSGKSEEIEASNTVSSEPPPEYAAVAATKTHLTWVAGYYLHGEERFCSVYRPSQRETIYHYSRCSLDMQTKFNDAMAQGLKLSFINVHMDPTGTTRYCHGYTRPLNETDQAPWYAAWDLDLKSFVSKNLELSQSGFSCVHLNACGTLAGNAIFAGIWEKPLSTQPLNSEVVHSVTLKELAASYSGYCFDMVSGIDRHHRDLAGTCAYEDDTGYIKFATVFTQARLGSAESPTQHTKYLLTRADLQRHMIEQEKAGNHIITVNPFVLTGQELFNCTWQKSAEGLNYASHIGLPRDGFEKAQRELAEV